MINDKKFRQIFIILLVTLVTIKILDILIALAMPIDPYITKSSRSIVLRELGAPGDYEIRLKNNNFPSSGTTKKPQIEVRKLRINSDGFILGPEDEQKSERNIDIVFVGGSTTETLHVKESFRFPHLVSQILEKKLDRPISSLNAGVAGSNSMHSNLAVLAKIVKYKPRFVVIMNNVNDWALLSKTGSYFEAPINRSIVLDNTVNPSFFNSVTVLLKKIKNLLMPNIYAQAVRPIILNLREEKDEFSTHRPADLLDVEVFIDQYRASLQTFINITNAWGIRPILMTQGSMILDDQKEKYDWNFKYEYLDRYISYQNTFNQEIIRIAQENAIPYIDLDKTLSGENLYFYDEVHLTNEGSIKAAQTIANSMLKLIE